MTMDEDSKNMAILLGYETVEVSRKINGKKSVDVRCLPVRKLCEYAALIEDEPALVELFTGMTPQQVDELSEPDFVAIVEKGHELNFTPFTAWLRRKVEARKMKAHAFGIDLPTNEPQTDGESSAGMSDGLPQTVQ